MDDMWDALLDDLARSAWEKGCPATEVRSWAAVSDYEKASWRQAAMGVCTALAELGFRAVGAGWANIDGTVVRLRRTDVEVVTYQGAYYGEHYVGLSDGEDCDADDPLAFWEHDPVQPNAGPRPTLFRVVTD